MDLDPLITLAGLVVGFVVGLTGMGGGALMTPILVLLFNVHPMAAVSSDLVASAVMKPVGAGVHLRRGTVHRRLVGWLVLGSVPAGFCGVLVLRAMGDGDAVQDRMKIIMGGILLVAAAAMVAKSAIDRRRAQAAAPGAGTPGAGTPGAGTPGAGTDATDGTSVGTMGATLGVTIKVRPLPTLAVGIVGGIVVGMTSVGSGSLIIVMLLALYPRIRGSQLVGTDLVQAVPLVAAASLGHLIFGDFQLGLTGSLLLGSLPGVYLGARISAGAATGHLIRPALVLVVSLSGLKLVGVPTVGLGVALLVLLVGVGAVLGWQRRGADRAAGRGGERAGSIRSAPTPGPVGGRCPPPA